MVNKGVRHILFLLNVATSRHVPASMNVQMPAAMRHSRSLFLCISCPFEARWIEDLDLHVFQLAVWQNSNLSRSWTVCTDSTGSNPHAGGADWPS